MSIYRQGPCGHHYEIGDICPECDEAIREIERVRITTQTKDLRSALDWAEKGITEYEKLLNYGAPTPMLIAVRKALGKT